MNAGRILGPAGGGTDGGRSGRSRGNVDPQELTCPACGTRVYGPVTLDEVGVCIVCRALVVLDADGPDEVCGFNERGEAVVLQRIFSNIRLRYPTDAEETVWLANPRLQHAITVVAEYHRRHGSPSPTLNPPDDGGPGHG